MVSKKKVDIKNYLKKRNVKRFSIFIAISFIFLIFSKLSNDYKQTIALKVNLENLEDEIMLQNDSLNKLEAIIEAKGFALVPFIFNKTKAVDLDVKTHLSTEREHFVFNVQNHRFIIEDQLGSSYKLLSVKPDTLILPYSKRAAKYVPVILNTDIDFATGYDVKDGFSLDIDSVKIVGSSIKIDSIISISTEALSLNDVNTNIEEDINFISTKGIEIFPKSTTVRAHVKRFTEGQKQVPVQIRNKPANTNINYFPKSVTVSYYVDLDNYNLIEAKDFTVECDYGEIKKNQTYFVPKITKQPEFVKRVGMKQKRIDFIKL
ncbi:hypothetical protein [Winogradskyella flava]|uniref:hypothetical protein n=1 Tax=Winogradskyella flava TaxID=1884876 RepID=UPI00249014C7|nr:hypothetical protein [Winogradskyella flava]